MTYLPSTTRNKLETAVQNARDAAEAGARAALERLAVAESEPFAHLRSDERALRVRLRARARQLGDRRDPNTAAHEITRLVDECAYEHWHRMLFARFLAENGMLMANSEALGLVDTPITLAECDELAPEEGAQNGWELAGRYASKMLPQIFRPDAPVLAVTLAPEHQRQLEKILASLPAETFTASDALGWVYQFWQGKKKDEVNKSGVKIGADELPAVTQLFTEPYMVDFLLDNALGAWWATRRLSADDLQRAASEEELRQKAAIDGVPLTYLRFVRGNGTDDAAPDAPWQLAAGTFEGWPDALAELRVIDPSCGSGHFLVALLRMLTPMRMALEGLNAREAIDAILRQNIHGLELDERCVEIAAFAIALTAWTWPDAGGYRPLPELRLACSGLAISQSREEWLKLAAEDGKLRPILSTMHELFSQAPTLGSLINPRHGDAGKLLAANESASLRALHDLLAREADTTRDAARHEAAVVAQGLASAARLLVGDYHWVTTNVPYLHRGKQNATLRDFTEAHYSIAKEDLATVFLARCLDFCLPGGTTSVVLPQNWLFLTSYRQFREALLKEERWNLVARLGAGAFETISGEVVNAILLTITHGQPTQAGALFEDARSDHLLRGLDVSEPKTAGEKAEQLITAEVKSVLQAAQLENPDARVMLEHESVETLLSDYADSLVGLQTGDDPCYLIAFWELPTYNKSVWELLQSTPNKYETYSGQSWMVRWERGQGALLSSPKARATQGLSAVGYFGIAMHRMREIYAYAYSKERFHQNIATLVPKELSHLPAIWCYCSSPEYHDAVRQIDQKLNVTNATLAKVPFDLEYWSEVAEEKYPHGLPEPYSDDPTQWIFHGHPCGSVVWDEDEKWTREGALRTDDTVLQTAIARLLGYQWPAERDPDMALAEEQRAWVARSAALNVHADTDGIVCIPALRGEQGAEARLLELLADAYGSAWSSTTLDALLASVGHRGKTLDSWLRDKFFAEHCKMFHQRPFIWQIWDGIKKDGFSALVNYHKLDRKLLETLTYTYLGDWIHRQQDEVSRGIDGAEERLQAAHRLKVNLELILEGEAPYDIFVRWKSLEDQPVGWEPDLNDGVRMNIRPFMMVPDVGAKGAGILRSKPNINWSKDRGTDVPSAPWYDLGPDYGEKKGARINDHHLSLKDKTDRGSPSRL